MRGLAVASVLSMFIVTRESADRGISVPLIGNLPLAQLFPGPALGVSRLATIYAVRED